ncbi:MAG: PTS sugar transporter subunit IIA [Candidatus Cloacimonadota bacterium]|nr:MAG: PTS sugar transporter subunit IIA [Candidatus Cloacimonadota bacterium]
MAQRISKTKRVYELLNRKSIFMQLEKGSKEETIMKLISYLQEEEIDGKTKKDIFNAIMKREFLESTGIGNGIAIPHARLNAIKDFYIVLGLSKDGIDFDAIDKKPVYIVFLVLSREEDKVLYIRILARLARLLHNREFRIQLLEQKNPDDVLNFIKKYESF